jgi:hypothetical protein
MSLRATLAPALQVQVSEAIPQGDDIGVSTLAGVGKREIHPYS